MISINNILSTKPDLPSTSDTTLSERGETIITMTIRKPSIYKFRHHVSNMKGDIMVYYAKEQKFNFFHHASFFINMALSLMKGESNIFPMVKEE
jgi:hypothetical protein